MSKLKENYGNPIKGSDPFISDPFIFFIFVNYCSGAYSAGKYTGYISGGLPLALRGAAAFGATRLGNRLLNSNRYFRIGPGRMPRNGALPPSTNAPRVSIGKGPGNPHFDLRVGS
jgi:hypothetical protein